MGGAQTQFSTKLSPFPQVAGPQAPWPGFMEFLLPAVWSLKAIQSGLRDHTTGVHSSGPEGSLCGQQEEPDPPGKHSQGLCFVTSSCSSRASPEGNREEEAWGGQWAHRTRLRTGPPFHGATPRQCPESFTGEGCGHYGTHPLLQPNQDVAWKIRALKGRQGLRPPSVSAASWGWFPSD